MIFFFVDNQINHSIQTFLAGKIALKYTRNASLTVSISKVCNEKLMENLKISRIIRIAFTPKILHAKQHKNDHV